MILPHIVHACVIVPVVGLSRHARHAIRCFFASLACFFRSHVGHTKCAFFSTCEQNTASSNCPYEHYNKLTCFLVLPTHCGWYHSSHASHSTMNRSGLYGISHAQYTGTLSGLNSPLLALYENLV